MTERFDKIQRFVLETADMDIASDEWKNLLVSCAGLSDMVLQPCHTDLFAMYAVELLNWNRRTNLTAITDPAEVAIKHFADCLVPAQLIDDDSNLLDIGSGAGFPGIVLKIFKPSLNVTLIEASHKKVSFQKHIIRLLGLKNIEAYHLRAEEAAKKTNFIKNFDVIICRAFSALNNFVAMALPFLRQNGHIIAMMGKFSEQEMHRVREAESRYRLSSEIEKYCLPLIGADRSLVSMRYSVSAEDITL